MAVPVVETHVGFALDVKLTVAGVVNPDTVVIRPVAVLYGTRANTVTILAADVEFDIGLCVGGDDEVGADGTE
ncbi:MAG TPA: hypothetical protein VLG47_07915 [Candidatus Saccharimonadales bacterium]|nr:hypothetical protein [Candidatus Saccharimonadales bacterium]